MSSPSTRWVSGHLGTPHVSAHAAVLGPQSVGFHVIAMASGINGFQGRSNSGYWSNYGSVISKSCSEALINSGEILRILGILDSTVPQASEARSDQNLVPVGFAFEALGPDVSNN